MVHLQKNSCMSLIITFFRKKGVNAMDQRKTIDEIFLLRSIACLGYSFFACFCPFVLRNERSSEFD